MKRYAFLLLPLLVAACNSSKQTATTRVAERFVRVLEYTPAPGQFINEPMSGFAGETTAAGACAYAERRFDEGLFVSLGGWGGYLVAAFDTPVSASATDYDLFVIGNQMLTSSEPGVVYVACDSDGDGSHFGETWYELRGSEFANSNRRYSVTYRRPAADGDPVTWVDNAGRSGEIGRIAEHVQNYFPAWLDGAERTYEGTLLPDNVDEGEVDDQGRPVTAWIARPFLWGYADNWSSGDRQGSTNRFRIADAVTADGAPAGLTHVDFIRIQTGVNLWRPAIGELSTEVVGIGCYRTLFAE